MSPASLTKPTQSRVLELFNFDFNAGVITRRITKNYNAKAGDIVGCKALGYLQAGIDGKNYQLHRIVWLAYYGRWPIDQIDHINGIRDDNRISNFREVDDSENRKNQRISKANTSGSIGVGWHSQRNKWRAYIKLNGKNEHFGLFEFKKSAIAARKLAEQKYGFHENHGSAGA